MAAAVALPMNPGGWHPSWDPYQQHQHPSTSPIQHPHPAMPYPSSGGPYVQYHGPHHNTPAFVPAPLSGYHSSDTGAPEQYYHVHINLPTSYGTGFYQDTHNEQHDYHHEAMIAQFSGLSMGTAAPVPAHLRQMYPQLSPQYFYDVPPQPGYFHQGQQGMYPPTVAVPCSVPSGEAVRQYPNPEEGSSSSVTDSRNRPHHGEDFEEEEEDKEEEEEGAPTTSEGGRQRPRNRNRKEARILLEQDQLQRFHELWDIKGINPSTIAPEALADEILRIQATLHLRSAIQPILSDFIQRQIPREGRPAFRQRLNALWLTYNTIRSTRGEVTGSTTERTKEAQIRREANAEEAIATTPQRSNMSDDDIDASEFVGYLFKKGFEFAKINDKTLEGWARLFIQRDLRYPGFETKEKAMASILKYIHKVRPGFPPVSHSNLLLASQMAS